VFGGHSPRKIVDVASVILGEQGKVAHCPLVRKPRRPYRIEQIIPNEGLAGSQVLPTS
jgi:hypothetical protein